MKNPPYYPYFRGISNPMRFFKLLTLFPFFLACAHAVAAAELHVHPRGDDNNPGTSAKPLRTFDGARAEVRKRANKKEPVYVHFASGTYSAPVIFHAADSGTAAAPVIYQAAAGADVVISGGTPLQLDWTPFKVGIFQARVPDGFKTDQLFVNGRRMHLARYPNFDAKAQYFGGTAADAFSNERATRWADPRGGFIHAMHAIMGRFSLHHHRQGCQWRRHLRRGLAEQSPVRHAQAISLCREHF
jgi:hypothetical protein